MTIGARIKQARESAKLSPQELAQRLWPTATPQAVKWLQQVEAGEVPTIGAITLRQIEDVLGLKRGELEEKSGDTADNSVTIDREELRRRWDAYTRARRSLDTYIRSVVVDLKSE